MLGNYFYGHGKLLLCSEYFVLDGAKSLALPTVLGQNMSVKYRRSSSPKLIWKSYDSDGKLWFECDYDLWRFDTLTNHTEEAKTLQKILRQARVQNIHFLREEVDTIVETRLEFPLNWGLGSSSSLIYNIAQWAYISPFELQEKTFGGSGYDVACAQSVGPISFQKSNNTHSWEAIEFNPIFKDDLYFVYLNRKQNTRSSIDSYYNLDIKDKSQTINKLNSLYESFINCFDIKCFEDTIYEHEDLISKSLNIQKVKDIYFKDYWGAVKSLGAWGGDFALVTSTRGLEDTKRYFTAKGFNTIIRYSDLISERSTTGESNLLKDCDEQIQI